MNDHQRATAASVVEAAEQGTMTFPDIVAALADAGFESYTIDFRRAVATYYLPDGDSLQLDTHHLDTPVAADFDTTEISAAIRDAQHLVPGYTYPGFCNRIAAAGCAGYIVSILGRRAVYIGRTAEAHVEHFPTPTPAPTSHS